MPLPRSVADFNRRVTNRFTSHVVGRLPGFALLTHVGRRSGTTYRTPVNVFRRRRAYRIALTYGSHAEWVRNVVAAGGCEIQTRGRVVRLVDPVVVEDPSRSWAPLPVRLVLGAIDADEYLQCTAVDERQ